MRNIKILIALFKIGAYASCLSFHDFFTQFLSFSINDHRHLLVWASLTENGKDASIFSTVNTAKHHKYPLHWKHSLYINKLHVLLQLHVTTFTCTFVQVPATIEDFWSFLFNHSL